MYNKNRRGPNIEPCGTQAFMILLISIVGKVMEQCVFKHINNYLLNHNIIMHCQSGFTKGDSAINQMVDITNNIGKALDDGKEFRIVFWPE
jgi:hypothetical protein